VRRREAVSFLQTSLIILISIHSLLKRAKLRKYYLGGSMVLAPVPSGESSIISPAGPQIIARAD
jgi:hypothetical protein